MDRSEEPAARERLLNAAVALFARKGYHATSVREIVAAAGVTKPVLYYWLRNKEGVFRELLQLAVAAHDAVLADVRASGGTAGERILRLGERVVGLIGEHAELVRVFDAVYHGPREGAPQVDFDPLFGAFDRFLRELVEEGVRCGEFRAGEVDAMHGALLGAFLVCDTAACGVAGRRHGAEGRAPDVRRVMNVVLAGMRATEEDDR